MKSSLVFVRAHLHPPLGGSSLSEGRGVAGSPALFLRYRSLETSKKSNRSRVVDSRGNDRYATGAGWSFQPAFPLACASGFKRSNSAGFAPSARRAERQFGRFSEPKAFFSRDASKKPLNLTCRPIFLLTAVGRQISLIGVPRPHFLRDD